MHAPIRKSFVRSKKLLYFLAYKFICTATRKTEIKRDKVLTECEFFKFEKNKNTVGSKFYKDVWLFQKQLIQTSTS